MKKEIEKEVEEIVKFVMDKANGIDDYNWGQDKFEKDVRGKINQLLQQERERIIEEIRNLPRSDDTSHFQAGEENTISRIIDKIKTLNQ